MLFLMKRCSWCSGDEAYCDYHDDEWGVVSHDDRYLFEMLVLEGAQAGLSWITILKKREAYGKAFADWDYKKVAGFGDEDVSRLMRDEGIVRNRRKIEAVINNARVFLEIRSEFGSFDKYIWSWTDGEVLYRDGSLVRNELSGRVSADLVRRGMKFVGPVIVYSYLEAIGVLCNHERGCWKFDDEKFK
jgi:DNA-3-methyladenine glycosylase I